LAAGALWLGERSAVSHRAAAILWELDGVEAAPLEFSTATRRRWAEAGLVLHRVRVLPPSEIANRRGIRVTSVPRTLVDLSAVVEPAVVELALEAALRRGLATVDRIRAALGRSSPTHPGRGQLRSLLAQQPPTATESALETLVWRLLRAEKLPLPIRQYEVRGPRGDLVARVDFAYPEARLALEADGYEFHSSPRDWRRDRARQNALIKLGWVVYRITWEDATRGSRALKADVARLLARVRRSSRSRQA
jgi:very-short-patch-repair endonuclease